MSFGIYKPIIYIVRLLIENKFDYMLFGSSVLKLRGLTKKANDIDIMVDQRQFQEIKNLLWKDKQIRSKRLIKDMNEISFKLFGYDVEIFGVSEKNEFRLLGKMSYPFFTGKKNKDVVVKHGEIIKIIPLKDQLLGYKYMYSKDHKEKRLVRIKEIENVFGRK